MDGVDELSKNIPSWFHPAYFTLLFFIALLATVVKMGPVYRTPQNSAVSLVLLDSFAVAIIFLTLALLLLAFTYGDPWRSISYKSLGPLGIFVSAIVFANVSKVHRRGFLNLWVRIACVVCVTDMCVDYQVFLHLTKLFLYADGTDTQEPDVLALLKADTPGGISAAPDTKGSSWPFWSALKMWWKQGTPEQIPHVLVVRKTHGLPKPVRLRRHLNHGAAIQALMCVARVRLDEHSYHTPAPFVNLRIVTSFDKSVRTVMHERFGSIWHRVTGSSCISRDTEAWWFVGAEVVQALKAACGITFISDRDFCNNVKAAWEWVVFFGSEWRKPFQIGPIAVELARSQMEDPNVVVHYGLGLAGEGKYCYVPNEAELCLAIETNIIACLGLAVSAQYRSLEKEVSVLVTSYVQTLQRHCDAIIGLDRSGSPAIIAIPSERWPKQQLAAMIVEWISTACDHTFTVHSGRGTHHVPAGVDGFAMV